MEPNLASEVYKSPCKPDRRSLGFTTLPTVYQCFTNIVKILQLLLYLFAICTVQYLFFFFFRIPVQWVQASLQQKKFWCSHPRPWRGSRQAGGLLGIRFTFLSPKVDES